MTIQQIQEMITNKGDVREIINQLADYIQANPGGGGGGELGYDVYTALMNDDGEGAYVSSIGAGGPGTPFKNTIGNIVWSKQGTGIFKGTLAGAFPEGKTFFLPQPAISPLSWILLDWEDENTVKIETKAFSGGSWSNSDYTLYLTSIEIRVYP